MHMNSAPHLLAEDRPEFERVLDEALLGTAQSPPSGTARLNSEQLRTMARTRRPRYPTARPPSTSTTCGYAGGSRPAADRCPAGRRNRWRDGRA